VRFARELRLFRQFCPAGRILDVGCSTGAFLDEVERRWPGQYERLGTDVVGAALDHAESRGVPVRRQSFLEPPPDRRPWDAVTFWAVLEHLADPLAFLRQAAELLRPGGHCFILVPNFRSLAVRLAGPRYRYVMPEHVNYFTPDTLRRLAAQVPDFREADLRFTHFNPVVIAQDLCRGRQPVGDAERVALLRTTTGWKQNRALAWLGPFYRAAEALLGGLWLADNVVLVLRKEAPAVSAPSA
jgi:SAM-dependent methyltransferase